MSPCNTFTPAFFISFTTLTTFLSFPLAIFIFLIFLLQVLLLLLQLSYKSIIKVWFSLSFSIPTIQLYQSLPMFLVINIHLYYMLNGSLLVEETVHLSYIYRSFYFFQLKSLLFSKLQTYDQLCCTTIQQLLHCYSFLCISSLKSNLYYYFSEQFPFFKL